MRVTRNTENLDSNEENKQPCFDKIDIQEKISPFNIQSKLKKRKLEQREPHDK